MFGGVTVVSGVLGTVAGGFLLDRMTSTIPNAFKVNILPSDRLVGHFILLLGLLIMQSNNKERFVYLSSFRVCNSTIIC